MISAEGRYSGVELKTSKTRVRMVESVVRLEFGYAQFRVYYLKRHSEILLCTIVEKRDYSISNRVLIVIRV